MCFIVTPALCPHGIDTAGYGQLVPRTARKQTTRTMSDGINRQLVPH